MKTSRKSKGRGASAAGVVAELLPFVVLAVAFVGVGVFHVTARVMVVEAGYRLSRLETENREMIRENDTLKLELATLKSPARMEKLAREQLGMTPPPPGAVLSPSRVKARTPRPELMANTRRPTKLETP
ncbi:MAG: cell division protein FtsL [Myxococcota bacterium]|nr:cell division protein FtsL [Myxococcota bacterium]